MLEVALLDNLLGINGMKEVLKDVFDNFIVSMMQILDPRIGSIEIPSKVTSRWVEEKAPLTSRRASKKLGLQPLGKWLVLLKFTGNHIWTPDGSPAAKAKLAFLFFKIALLKLRASKEFISKNKEKDI